VAIFYQSGMGAYDKVTGGRSNEFLRLGLARARVGSLRLLRFAVLEKPPLQAQLGGKGEI